MRKNNKYQIDIEEWNWKQIKLLQEGQKQKLEIKRIRAKVEILKKGPTYNFWGRREKKNKGHKFDDLSHEPLVDPIYCYLSFFKKKIPSWNFLKHLIYLELAFIICFCLVSIRLIYFDFFIGLSHLITWIVGLTA